MSSQLTAQTPDFTIGTGDCMPHVASVVIICSSRRPTKNPRRVENVNVLPKRSAKTAPS